MINVPEIEVNSAMELVELLDRFGETPDLLFRGESSQYGELTTTIERHRFQDEDIERFKGVASHIFRDGLSPGDSLYRHLTEAEAYLLRLFQSRAKHHLSNVPQIHETTEWLALMQHHGAPTRLLDVTKSLLTAAYFATEHRTRHSGIIYIFFTPNLALEHACKDGQITYNPPEIGLIGQDLEFSEKVKELNQLTNWRTRGSQLGDWAIQMNGHFPERISRNKNLKGILQIENKYPTQREIAQQGCFLMPLSLVEPFENHLQFTYEFMNAKHKDVPEKLSDVDLDDFMKHWPVLKLRIPRDTFRIFKISLQHMGISPEMLFPDFDGLAKAMHGQLTWHKEVNGIFPD